MVADHSVQFIARDPKRQEIAWVRITHPDGTETVYRSLDDPLSKSEQQALPVRTMECLDCHSRPAHRFESPVRSVDRAIKGGGISLSLPEIKPQAVRALDGGYVSSASAMSGIEQSLTDFYDENYPEIAEEESENLASSIATLQSIYRSTIFPEMKADWSVHPDNIGHRDWPGCFRCHNDDLVSDRGQTIFTTCTKCHVVLAQGEDVVVAKADFSIGSPFVHPEDDDTIEEFTLCTDCHTGGYDLYE